MNQKLLNQIADPYMVLNWTQFEDWPSSSFQLPTLQAHRGYWVEGSQENSREAFFAAAQKGYQMCELDVRLTKDFIPVVYHDKKLSRLNNKDVEIRDLNYDEFVKMTGGSSLKEILLAKDLTPYFNVEIKSDQLVNDDLTTLVAHVIRDSASEQRVLVSSFNPLSLMKIKNILPQTPRALLVTHESTTWNLFYLRKMLMAPLVRPHILHLDDKMLDPKTLGRLQGFPLAVWTVNDDSRAKHLLGHGVKSVISDRCLPF